MNLLIISLSFIRKKLENNNKQKKQDDTDKQVENNDYSHCGSSSVGGDVSISVITETKAMFRIVSTIIHIALCCKLLLIESRTLQAQNICFLAGMEWTNEWYNQMADDD